MSAYLVDEYHIGAMLKFWERHSISRNCRAYWKGDGHKVWQSDTLNEPFEILARENFDSVFHRYEESKLYEDSEPVALPDVGRDGEPQFRLNRYGHHSPVEILKACDCLEYQSCEKQDYFESHAYAILDQIRRCAIRKVEGYEDANGWELTPHAPRRVAQGVN